MSRRARLFARQPQLAPPVRWRRAGRVHQLGQQSPFVARCVGTRMLGISARRTLPPFAREPFTTWFARQTWHEDGPPVVLFADTFNNYHHPETARAAAEFSPSSRPSRPRSRCGRLLWAPPPVEGLRHRGAGGAPWKAIDLLYPYAEQGNAHRRPGAELYPDVP